MSDLANAVQTLKSWEELIAERRRPSPSFAAIDASKQALTMLAECALVRSWLDEIEQIAVCESQLCGAAPEAAAQALGLGSVDELLSRWPDCIVRDRTQG